MQIHELKIKHQDKKRKRVGRGGKRGTYSGRGQKGQKSRAGRKMKPVIRELIKRYPKIRGYKFNIRPKNMTASAFVNLDVLDKNFKPGEKITPEILLEKHLIRRIKGRAPKVKILGGGELSKALSFENCSVSEQAGAKIEKAGGTVKI